MTAADPGQRPDPEAQALIERLGTALRGPVLTGGHPDYEDARRVWNGLIDRQPRAIARCADARDVVETVRGAREHRPVVSIRGGGHQIAGSAVCDDGLVIDLSDMRDVQVDPETRTARVQAGARWADVDRATQEVGLVTTGGEVSTTGVAGLTLGGGLGLTMRAFGLACDNLRSLDIVTADGTLRTADRDEHPDLFWAARGGGRGLGVVTAFEFDLHPLGPDVASALTMYPLADGPDVFRAWRDYVRQAPDEVTPQIGLWSVPALPDLPEDLHGVPVVLALGTYAGDPAEAGPVLTGLRQLGTPLLDLSGTEPYVDTQSALDELFPEGGRYYWKSHFLDELSDDLIGALLDHGSVRPSPDTLVLIRTLGGAVGQLSNSDTAFAHRSAGFNLSLDASWSDPALDDAALRWTRSTWTALEPFSTGGTYINFAGFEDESGDLRPGALGANQARIDRIRQAYDPDGLFESAALRP